MYVRKFELRFFKVHKLPKLNSMLATLKVSQIWKRTWIILHFQEKDVKIFGLTKLNWLHSFDD